MGYGSYTASDWIKLRESRGIHETSSATNIFRNNEMKDAFNPKFIQTRESRDSEDSPESTPIIIGFDVTGSMGYLAEEIAKNALNKTILNIYDKKPVTNPHVMCAAIGDVCDSAPLQVTQFEADIRIVEQLMELWLEMRGGDAPEAYNLLWYFADKHTSIDAYEKRGKKGFLFTIGDAATKNSISSGDLKDIFNDETKTQTNDDMLKSVSEKYEVYHIVTRDILEVDRWEDILPGRVAYISDKAIGYLSEVITSIMQISNGMSKADAIAQWPDDAKEVVSKAVEKICVNEKKPETTSDESETKKDSFFDRLF